MPSFDMAITMARRYVEGNMTATVRITRPTDAVLDTITGELDSVTLTGVYYGIGRVYMVSGPLLYGINDESQEFSQTYVSIPIEVDGNLTSPMVDDIVEVVDHPDALLVGKYFRVRDVQSGSQLPVTRLMQVAGAQRGTHWVDESSPDIPPEWLV